MEHRDSKKEDRILAIIPAFNEGKNIAGVISGIRNAYALVDILVVDDGSSDATFRIAKDAAVLAVSLPFNLGYGVALQTGYKYALKNNYDFVIQIDADGQHDARFIPHLADEVQNGAADIIIGSRFLSPKLYKADLIRRIGIRLFAKIVSLLIGQKITDPTSGFQALNRKTLEFYSRDIFPSDFPDADTLILSHLAGLRIKEIPVIMHRSPDGKRQMHSGFAALYYVFKMFFSILLTLLREKSELPEITLNSPIIK